MAQPLITVIVPTCNRPDFLSRCLAALAPGAQNLSPEQYEVIVTDDGDDDDAQHLVANDFPWALWKPGPRRGPAANRNSGAQYASGTWLAFTDDDCVPVPGWLEAYAGALNGTHSVYEGRTTCNDWIDSPLFEAPINFDGGYLWSCNMLIERDYFESLGGFDENYPYPAMEDIDLRERIREGGREFPFVPTAIVDHPKRLRAGGRVKGRYKECEFLFAVKHKRPLGLWSTFLVPLLFHHARMWKRSKVPLHVFPSAWNALVEGVYVTSHYAAWRRKYTPRS